MLSLSAQSHSEYVDELLHLSSPSHSPRSASDNHRIFRVPRMGRRTLGERDPFNISDL